MDYVTCSVKISGILFWISYKHTEPSGSHPTWGESTRCKPKARTLICHRPFGRSNSRLLGKESERALPASTLLNFSMATDFEPGTAQHAVTGDINLQNQY